MKRKIAIMLISVLTAVNLFSFSACGGEDLAQLKKENEALQQRLETLKQENGQAQTEKESLQNQFDDLNGQQQEILDEIKDLEDTIYGPPLELMEFDTLAHFFSGNVIGLKGDRTRFDLDDVTLDFYFGDIFAGVREIAWGYEYYDIYFSVQTGDVESFFIKRVNEPFYTKENQVKYTETNIGEGWVRFKCEFSHFQTLTIPKELFRERAGIIHINLFYENAERGINDNFWGQVIYYKIEYGKVRLFNHRIHPWEGEI